MAVDVKNACKESSEPKKTQDAALCFPNPKIISDIGSGRDAETLPEPNP